MFERIKRLLFGPREPSGEERARELRAKLEVKVLEQNLALWNNLVDPREPLFDQPDFYYPWGQGEGIPLNIDNQKRGEFIPVYLTEYGLKIIRDQSRRIATFNEFALNAVENRVSYIVGKGFQYRAVRKRAAHAGASGVGVGPADGLAAKVQRVLDEFVARTAWGEREQDAVRRCDVDGECFLRLFHLGYGLCDVRPVEPEHVRDNLGVPEQRFGVETVPGDIERVLAYHVVERPDVSYVTTRVPAEEVVHLKLNTTTNAKRGLPTFYAVRKNLERADKLLRNMSVLAQTQATFALIRKHKQYSAGAISAFQQAQTDQTFQSPYSGQTVSMKQLLPGTIIDTGENTEYEFPAATVDAGNLVAVLQAELRAVAARLVMPEFMLTVDASNANYASTLVAEAPSTKHFERLQAFYGRRFGDGAYSCDRESGGLTPDAGCGVLWRVVYYAVEYGGLPPEALTDVEIQVEGPPLTVRDRASETVRGKTLHDEGVLSKATWSKWEGLDYDREQEQLGEEPGAGLPPPAAGGGEGGGPAGGPPVPAPPGSAGGESEDLGEACVPNKVGKKYHDTKTGHPCKSPGSLSAAARAAAKKAWRTAAAAVTTLDRRMATRQRRLDLAWKDLKAAAKGKGDWLAAHQVYSSLKKEQTADSKARPGLAQKASDAYKAMSAAGGGGTPPPAVKPKAKAAAGKPKAQAAAVKVKHGPGNPKPFDHKDKSALKANVMAWLAWQKVSATYYSGLEGAAASLADKFKDASPGLTASEVQAALDELAAWEPPPAVAAAAATATTAKGSNPKLPAASRPAGLTAAETKALSSYTGGGYFDVNVPLRQGIEPAGDAGKVHAALQKAFARTVPFKEPVTVHRGMDLSYVALETFLKHARSVLDSGGTRVLPILGYVSTTTDEKMTFAGNVRLEIQARRGLDMKPYSDYPEEVELLLNHGSLFHVRGIEKVAGQWRIKMEQV